MATIEQFLQFNLDRLFTFLLFPPETDYGIAFFTHMREILIDMISLSQGIQRYYYFKICQFFYLFNYSLFY
jgi:hypothetical protein